MSCEKVKKGVGPGTVIYNFNPSIQETVAKCSSLSSRSVYRGSSRTAKAVMPGGGEKSVKAVLRIWEDCQHGLHDKGG